MYSKTDLCHVWLFSMLWSYL